MSIISIDSLDSNQLDVLKEIGNIGAGNSMSALSKMLNRKIDMTVPKVKILKFNEVNEILGGEELIVVGILVDLSGDITGSIMIIIKCDAARKLVDILMNNKTETNNITEENIEFSELELSALTEVGNILAGAYLSAISSLTSLNITLNIPYIAIDMAGAILSVPAIEFGKIGDSVLYIENKFTEYGVNISGDFFLIPDSNTYEILLKALGVIN